MLNENREWFKQISIKVGLFFSKIPLSPNQWTVFSLLPALLSGIFIAMQQYALAAFLFAIASFIDFIDGSVARVLGRTTRFGAYLDTIVDRYVEFFIVFGLFFASLPSFYLPAEAWLLLYLFGSMMTTYAKAAAKEKGLVDKELRGGFMERAERLIVLFAGILLAVFSELWLVSVIAALAVLSNASALQRIVIARKSAKTQSS